MVKDNPAPRSVAATYSFRASGDRPCSIMVRSFLTAIKTLDISTPVSDRRTVYPEMRMSSINHGSEIAITGKRCFRVNWRRSERRCLSPRAFYCKDCSFISNFLYSGNCDCTSRYRSSSRCSMVSGDPRCTCLYSRICLIGTLSL